MSADAFDRRWREAYPRLAATSRRLVGNADDAADVLQDVRIAAWRSFDAYDPARPFLPWVMTILSRAAVNAWRSRPA